jgi:hypothetical protein
LTKELEQLRARVVRAAGKRGEVLEVLESTQIPIEHHLLGDVGDVLLGFERMLDDVETVDRGAALGRLNEVQKQVDGGRLPSAIRSKQAEDFTPVDAQVKVIEGRMSVVSFCQTRCLQHHRESLLAVTLRASKAVRGRIQ